MNIHLQKLCTEVIQEFLPLSCVVCDTQITSGKHYPLCEDCKSLLVQIRSPVCALCGRSLISEEEICMECRRKSQKYDRLIPLYDYHGIARELLIAYKGKGHKSLASFFAERLFERLMLEGLTGGTLIPVPPRPGKLHKKGWDQVETICSIMENRYDMKVLRLLSRHRSLQEQKKLSGVERSMNIHDQFFLVNSEIPPEIILVDDICTTGATLSECAQVLKHAGVSRVVALVIAVD